MREKSEHQSTVRAEEGWTEIAILPNLRIDHAIKSAYMCLLPRSDPIVVAIEKSHPNFHRFISGFTDAFGVKIFPSVLVRRVDAPPSFRTMEAIASFRDLISISVVSLSRGVELQHPDGHRVTWSNSFWIYPWMIDKNDKYIISQTPAQLALHVPEEFNGQATPELPQMSLDRFEIDLVMMNALIKRWQRRYSGRHPRWADRALFRSLNMAHQAAALPAGSDTTLYDVGRLAALWVSAFEILVHPRTAKANAQVVCNLLEGVDWQSKRVGQRRYKVFKSKSQSGVRYSLPSWLYSKLYKSRNDFIHGNPISYKRMQVRGSGLPITRFAAPLYRLALSSFLGLRFKRAMPPITQPKKLGKYVSDHMRFYRGQSVAERAMSVAITKRPPDDD